VNTEVKITAIIAATVLLVIGGALGSCNYQAKLDAGATVVETCVQHPVTRSPFRGQP
jgi:hypothetical protein